MYYSCGNKEVLLRTNSSITYAYVVLSAYYSRLTLPYLSDHQGVHRVVHTVQEISQCMRKWSPVRNENIIVYAKVQQQCDQIYTHFSIIWTKWNEEKSAASQLLNILLQKEHKRTMEFSFWKLNFLWGKVKIKQSSVS